MSEAVDANTAEAGRRVERVVLDMLLLERKVGKVMTFISAVKVLILP